ncbi:coatomer protein complex [Aphelenchoides avenae]|nr:coatomer protein complex [Aphelenchus avenae]
MAGAVDALFDVRNNYYLGAFQQCVNDAQNAKVKDESDKIARDVYLYRAYIALKKPNIPLSEIDPSSAPSALKAVRRLADYVANASKRSKIVQEVDAELQSGAQLGEVECLMNALILLHEDNVDDALRVLNKASDSLECQSAIIQCLLKIHRGDLAVKAIKAMQEIDEDATITQLALAWVNMAIGKDKLKDAFYIYQELIDKYGATPSLLVSQSACLIQQQKYEDAEKVLLEAQQRDANNPEVVVNLILVSQFLGKPFEVTNRYIKQLKDDYPDHAWTKDFVSKEQAFERLSQESSA